MLLELGNRGGFAPGGEVARSFRRADDVGVSLVLFGDPYFPAGADGRFWAEPGDLLRRWRDNAAGMVGEIDGSFAVLVLEDQPQRLHVVTDRFGTHNIFFARSGESVLIGDRLVEIARRLVRNLLDPVGVRSFLLYGMILADRTLFSAIRKLAPATHYVAKWDEDRLEWSSEPYWTPAFPGSAMAAGEAVDRIVSTFTDTLRRSAADQAPLSLPLTSGKDSRAILSALYQQPTLHCYTHGDPADPDVMIARQLARELGVSHDLYPLDETWVAGILETSRRHAISLNGSIDHVRFLHVLSSYDREERRGGRFYPGAWGNEIFEGKFLRPEFLSQEDLEGAAAAALQIIGDARGADYALFPEGKHEVTGPYLEHLRNVIGRDPGWRQSPISTSIRLVQHTYSPHFFSVFSSYLAKRFCVFHAYLQKDAVDALGGVPVEELTRAALQHAVIARNLPQAVRFPLFSEGNYRWVPANPLNRVRDRLHRSGAPRKLDAALTRFFGRGLASRQYFVDYRRWLAEHHRGEIRELLRPDRLRSGEVLGDGVVERLLAGLEDGTLVNIHPVTRLLSLELFLGEVG